MIDPLSGYNYLKQQLKQIMLAMFLYEDKLLPYVPQRKILLFNRVKRIKLYF